MAPTIRGTARRHRYRTSVCVLPFHGPRRVPNHEGHEEDYLLAGPICRGRGSGPRRRRQTRSLGRDDRQHARTLSYFQESPPGLGEDRLGLRAPMRSSSAADSVSCVGPELLARGETGVFSHSAAGLRPVLGGLTSEVGMPTHAGQGDSFRTSIFNDLYRLWAWPVNCSVGGHDNGVAVHPR